MVTFSCTSNIDTSWVKVLGDLVVFPVKIDHIYSVMR